MSKLTLSNITTLANTASARSVLNANSDAIEAALENTLSRDGSTPNHMEADIDMNSHRVLNVADPVAATDAVNLRSIQNLDPDGLSAAMLRQELTSEVYATPYLSLVSDLKNHGEVSLHRFIDPTKLAAIRDFTSTYDATADIQAAFDDADVRHLFIPTGVHNFSASLIRNNNIGLSLRGATSSASTLRAQGAAGLVFTGGSLTGIENNMPKLDLAKLRIEAAVANAGDAVTMTYPNGSGTPSTGPVWNEVVIVPAGEITAIGGPGFNKAVRGTNVRDFFVDRMTIAGAFNAVGHPMNPTMTHGFHMDGDSDPVEIHLNRIYAYYLQTMAQIQGQYEGVYVRNSTTVAIWSFLRWLSPTPNPTIQVMGNYIGSQRLGVEIDMVSYGQIQNNEFNATGPVPQQDYRALVVNRSAVPGVSNQTVATTISGNKFIGVGFSSVSAFTETGIDVVSGNTLDIHGNYFYDMDIGVRIANISINTENEVHSNRYFNCSLNESIPAATRRAVGNDVGMRATTTGDVAFAANGAAPGQKITFNTQVEDRGGNYYDAAGGKYNPPPGLYESRLSVQFSAGILVGDYCIVEVRKNYVNAGSPGTVVQKQGLAAGYPGACQVLSIAQIEMGAGDFLEAYVTVLGTAGSRTAQGSATVQTYWQVDAVSR